MPGSTPGNPSLQRCQQRCWRPLLPMQPTCTAAPLRDVGWKLFMIVCLSSMYGRIPLACRQGGAERCRRLNLVWPARQHNCQKGGRGRQAGQAGCQLATGLLGTAEAGQPGKPCQASSPDSIPVQSPTVSGPAACPGAGGGSRAGCPHPLTPPAGGRAGLQRGRGSTHGKAGQQQSTRGQGACGAVAAKELWFRAWGEQ